MGGGDGGGEGVNKKDSFDKIRSFKKIIKQWNVLKNKNYTN